VSNAVTAVLLVLKVPSVFVNLVPRTQYILYKLSNVYKCAVCTVQCSHCSVHKTLFAEKRAEEGWHMAGLILDGPVWAPIAPFHPPPATTESRVVKNQSKSLINQDFGPRAKV
jgi:hypothetical protein